MAWDKTRCHEGILAPDLNDDIRANYEAIEADLNREHKFSTGGTAADQIIHRQGSARCFFQATAPAKRLDGVTAFTSDDNGSVWIDSDNNKTYILTDYSVPTWTAIEDVTIATLLAAARQFAEAVTFDKAAVLSKAPTLTEGIAANDSYLQARNVADDGNVNLIKAGANDLPTLPDSAEMASSAAPVEDEAIANKKYVDDQITAIQDPAYAGGESHSFIGGLGIKMGIAAGIGAVTFGAPFANDCISAVASPAGTAGTFRVHSVSKTGFTIAGTATTYHWIAIGY